MTDTPEVRHEPDDHRFVMELEGGRAQVSYHLHDGALDILHTYVPRQHRNQGLGEAIVVHALVYAKENGLRVIPTCPFVPRVLNLHPEYDDLVGTDGSEGG